MHTTSATPASSRRVPLRRVLATVATTAALLATSFVIAPVTPASAVDTAIATDAATLAAAFAGGGDVTLEESFRVTTGDAGIFVRPGASVTLNLNGHELTVAGDSDHAGIEVPTGATLTITDSPAGTGVLTAIGGDYSAGIGGGHYFSAGGIIKITGGTVTATGGDYAAGIGGGYDAAGDDITITDSTVTATAGNQGAGIGGGYRGAGGNTTITDSTVTATATGAYGAGIGGGYDAAGGNTTITDSTVTASGGDYAAGIGGAGMDDSNLGAGGNTEITSSTVTANGGPYGAGIGGGGYDSPGGNTTITDSTVTAGGGDFAAALGGSIRGAGAIVTIDSDSHVTVSASANSPSTVIGAGRGGSDFGSLSNAGTLTIAAGSPLVIPVGTTVLNSGVIRNHGTIAVNGEITNSGSIITTADRITNPLNVTDHNYLVTFDGSLDGAPSTLQPRRVFSATFAAAELDLPTNPIATGHSFAGWFTDAARSIPMTTTTTLSDITAYAKWTIDPRTVTFSSEGGTGIDPVTTDYGTTITAPSAPTRTGYTFKGWYTAATAGQEWNFTNSVTENATVYAQWTVQQRTVTFSTQGGSTIAAVSPNYGTSINAPKPPTRTGYTFKGWYTKSTSGTAVKFPVTVTENTTVYAQWTAEKRTVTFNSQGGSKVAAVSTDYNTTIKAPKSPTLTGYTFKGWYTKSTAGSVWNFASKVTSNTTVYAQWTVQKRTVTFNSQGGSKVAAVSTNYNTAIKAPKSPTRSGYTFTGWYTKSIGGSVWKFTTKVTANATAYAHWTLKR